MQDYLTTLTGQSDIVILLVLLTAVRVWTIKLPEMIDRDILPFKPFNCTECLSFWTGVAVFALTLNPIYFTLYLLNDVYDRNL